MFRHSIIIPLAFVWATVFAAAQLIHHTPNPAPTTAAPVGPSILDEIQQMSQLDINAVMLPMDPSKLNPQEQEWLDQKGRGYGWINETLVSQLLDQRKIGSLFNSPSAGGKTPVPPLDWWRRMQNRLYELSRNSGIENHEGVPLLFGLDSVHGANYIYNATLFPQQIGLAATFNRTCAFHAGEIGGKETRAAGVTWAFSPILGIAVQPSWARVFETFGEDPFTAEQMGVQLIKGLQSVPDAKTFPNASFPINVAACMKHYIGYPNVRTGHDRTPVWTPMNLLMQYFAPPFEAAIKEAKVLSVMENYIELNGRPVVGSHLILQFLLRDVMQFDGMLVTDYNEIYNQYDFHHSAGSYSQATYHSFNRTSIDMGMIGWLGQGFPDLADAILENYRLGLISSDRIAQAATRVLKLKFQVGIHNPVPPEYPNVCMFGCDSHHAKALDATRQSITLLQNEGSFLPIQLKVQQGMKIAVIGQACDSVPLMAGGWTVHWQGTSNKSAFGYGSTIREELAARGADVTFSMGCNVTENSVCGAEYLSEAVENARNADRVVVCIGERHYAEKPGDIDDLTLPGQQIMMVEQIAAVNKNIVAVLIEGRPRILNAVPKLVKAIIHGYLPGPYGGKAITEVIVGEINPSGSLPITYPLTVNNAPIQYFRKYSANTGNDYAVQWPFGHGLSYSQLSYGPIYAGLDFNDGLLWAAGNITNNGPYDADVPVHLYSTQPYRTFTPEVQMQRNFTKIHLKVGETKHVRLEFLYLRLSYIDEYMCQTIETVPVWLTMNNQEAIEPVIFRDFDFHKKRVLNDCTKWTQNAQKNTGLSTILGPPVAPKTSHTQEYFISSVVCFGAGIVGTVIIVSLVRRRGNNKPATTHLDILEPSGV